MSKQSRRRSGAASRRDTRSVAVQPSSSLMPWLVGIAAALTAVAAVLIYLVVQPMLSSTSTTTTQLGLPPATQANPGATISPGAKPVTGPTAKGVPLTTLPKGMGPLGDHARRRAGDPMALGNVDAPVVLLIYEDYACPFCAKFTKEHEPKLKTKYVDTGKVRFEWRDFPLFGEESEMAAAAGQAAGKQGKFWEFKTSIHATAPERGHPPLPRQVLLDHARKVGVADMARFEKDMDAPATKTAVTTDATEAERLGFTSTPSFIINGRPLIGAQPIRAFEQVIDQSLAAAGR